MSLNDAPETMVEIEVENIDFVADQPLHEQRKSNLTYQSVTELIDLSDKFFK